MEWTTASDFGANETKIITVVNDIDGDTVGCFILKYGDESTYPLSHNASAADVQEALESLSTVAEVNVTSSIETSSPADGNPVVFGSSWMITFLGETGALPKAGYACTSCVSSVSNVTNALPGQKQITVNVTSDLRNVLNLAARFSVSTGHSSTSEYNSECHLQAEMVGKEVVVAVELPGSACSFVDGPNAALSLRFNDPLGLRIEHVDLRSISGKGFISAYVMDYISGTSPHVYGYTELNAKESCGLSMLGPSSNVQRLILSAASGMTVTSGSYRLALGEHLTRCISYNATPTELEMALDELPNVAGKTSVFGRVFVDNGTYYPVDDEEAIVTDGLGYDYLVRFGGIYPSRGGTWPKLRVPSEYFGRSISRIYGCERFMSNDADAEPIANVMMVKQESACISGNPSMQVILAEASSALGGSFSVNRADRSLQDIPLSSTAAEMETFLSDALAIPVRVQKARIGTYSMAWLIRSRPAAGGMGRLAVCDRFSIGTNIAVGIYDAVVITTGSSSGRNTGHFRVTIGGEVSDLLSFDASDGRVDLVLQAMVGVGKVTAMTPIHMGGGGGVDIPNVMLFNNSASVETVGDWTKTVAPGDAAVFASLDDQYFEISSLAYSTSEDITTFFVDHTVTGLPVENLTTAAIVGTAAISRIPLPGRARMVSNVRVLYSYPNVGTAVRSLQLSAGGVEALGITLNSTIIVARKAYNIHDYKNDLVELTQDFVGPTVVAGDVELKVFSTSMSVSFTRDISYLISTGDSIWIENDHGDMDELEVEQYFASNGSYRLSGLFSSQYEGSIAYTVGGGRTWTLVFKHTNLDLDTFQVETDSSWRGLGGTVRVQRPGRIAPRTVVLGSPSEIQTVALRSSQRWWSTMNTERNSTWSLILWPEDGPTVDLPWGASAEEVAAALGSMSGVSSVDVERLGDGESAEWFYGFVYSISFWGVHPSSHLPQLTVISSLSGVTAYVNTVRQGVAFSAHSQTFTALKEDTEYSIRARAFGTQGYGPASSIVMTKTPSIGVVPGKPTAVLLGTCQHDSTSLGVIWQPPLENGGQSVDAYRVEWDRWQSFSESSAAYGTHYLGITHEVQEIFVNFRSGDSIAPRGGTFTVSWGGHFTADLPWDSSASALEAAILGISGVQELAVNPISVTRVPYRNGFRWIITFMAWRGDLALLQGDGSLLVGDDPSLTFKEKVAGSSDIFPGGYTNEVQAVAVTSLSPVSGSFTLTFEGEEVAPVAFNESPESFKSKLEAIETIFCVDVKRFTMNAELKLYSWHITLAWLNGDVIPGAGNIGLFGVRSVDLDGNGADVKVFELVAGTNPKKIKISNLLPGVQYFCRVAAHNSRGFGEFSEIAVGVPRGQPGPPVDATLAIRSSSSLTTTWSPPASNGGADVSGYLVEWFAAADPGTNEIQMISTSAKKGVSEVQAVSIKADEDNLGGYYRLRFDGENTANIAWDAPASGTDSIKEKLERLPGIGKVDVTQDYSRVAVAGLRVDVLVGADNAAVSNSSTLLPSQSGLVENDIVFLAGYRARVRGFSADGEALFFGSLDGYTQPDTFAEDFGAESVIVEKWAYGYDYKVTFSSYNGDAPLMEAMASDGWAGTNPVIDIHEVMRGSQPISGSFRLRFGRENTPPLNHDASADEVERALEGMIDVGDVTVSKVVNGFGHNWVVTFVSEVGDIGLMEADGTGLTGPSSAVAVSVGQYGIIPSMYGKAVISDASVLQYTIEGLTLGEAYSVRIRSGNVEGYGSAIGTTPASLRVLGPPGIPQDVRLIVMSNAMLKLVWSAPASGGGSSVTQYRVDWDTAADFPNIVTSGFYHVVSVGDAEGPYFYNIVVSAASSWIPRYARVRAYNLFAWSKPGLPEPASARPALRPPGEPQTVVLTVTSGVGLLVSWEAPSINLPVFGGNGGSVIEEYLIEWDTSAKFDSPARRVVVTMPSALSYLIGGRDIMTGEESTELEPGVAYYARVSAFNAQGYGPVVPTSPESATTEDQVPAPPEILGAEPNGATSVAGLLGIPTRDGGETLTKYRLEWDISDGFEHVNGSSRAGGWEDIPLVQETQAFAVSSYAGHEEQWVIASVEVTNERQTVRTKVGDRYASLFAVVVLFGQDLWYAYLDYRRHLVDAQRLIIGRCLPPKVSDD